MTIIVVAERLERLDEHFVLRCYGPCERHQERVGHQHDVHQKRSHDGLEDVEQDVMTVERVDRYGIAQVDHVLEPLVRVLVRSRDRVQRDRGARPLDGQREAQREAHVGRPGDGAPVPVQYARGVLAAPWARQKPYARHVEQLPDVPRVVEVHDHLPAAQVVVNVDVADHEIVHHVNGVVHLDEKAQRAVHVHALRHDQHGRQAQSVHVYVVPLRHVRIEHLIEPESFEHFQGNDHFVRLEPVHSST